MTRIVGWMAVLLYLAVVTAVVLYAPTLPESPTDETSQAPPARGQMELPLMGFALNVHHVDDVALYIEAIDQMAELGANAVEIITPAYQRDGASTEINIDPKRCPERGQLQQIIRHARQRELCVVFMPIVLFAQPRGTEWRGKIQPEDWDRWWGSYHRIICDFAELAELAQADVMLIGSELLSTEKQAHRWVPLVAEVRKRFTGRLGYSTNWDHYQTPTFWDRLDFIGINGYWKISDDADAAHAKLVERWSEIREQVLTFSERTDRPVLFTEIGYPSLPWALKDPWNYIAKGAEATPEVQLRGYEAFGEAWSDLLQPTKDAAPASPLMGVMFYEWDVFANGGPNDTGYGLRGRPAMDLLRGWMQYEQPDRDIMTNSEADDE